MLFPHAINLFSLMDFNSLNQLVAHPLRQLLYSDICRLDLSRRFPSLLRSSEYQRQVVQSQRIDINGFTIAITMRRPMWAAGSLLWWSSR